MYCRLSLQLFIRTLHSPVNETVEGTSKTIAQSYEIVSPNKILDLRVRKRRRGQVSRFKCVGRVQSVNAIPRSVSRQDKYFGKKK